MRDFREARYPDSQFANGLAPTRFLVDCEPLLPRGARVLVPGDGEGRNGAWNVPKGDPAGQLDLQVTEVEPDLDEGPFHQGRARLIRCVGHAP
jgi:hypothetical protein